MSMIGKTLGHYKIGDQPLGKGGMGEVYRAKEQKLGRDVAIKVLPEEFARDADRVARFQREAKLLAIVATIPARRYETITDDSMPEVLGADSRREQVLSIMRTASQFAFPDAHGGRSRSGISPNATGCASRGPSDLVRFDSSWRVHARNDPGRQIPRDRITGSWRYGRSLSRR